MNRVVSRDCLVSREGPDYRDYAARKMSDELRTLVCSAGYTVVGKPIVREEDVPATDQTLVRVTVECAERTDGVWPSVFATARQDGLAV